MTREELMKAVDLTDDKYIAEAAVPPAKKNVFALPGVKAALAVAACLAVFLFAGLILRNGVTPTYTDAPTSAGFSVSGTEETTTEKERTTEKTTQPSEESTAEITTPPTQGSTESPTEEPSAQTAEPSSQTTTADSAEPTVHNNAPTAPPEQRTEETTAEEPAAEPPTEPPTEPTTEPTTAEEPTGKTIGDILSVLGLFDSSAGEGELLGAPGQPGEQISTQLTEEEIAEIFGFSPSEKLVLPDGYARDEARFGKTEENGKKTFYAVYAFAKETDVVYLVLQKGDTAFSPELFDTPPVDMNGTDVYRMTEYDDHTDGTETYRNCLAAFESGGLTCVVFGSGYSVTTEELLIFAGNLLPPA